MRRLVTLALCLFAVPASATPVTIQTFLAQARPAPDASLSYGAAPTQGVDVYLPKGEGPHPVVLLIHGGCWMKLGTGREQLRAISANLANRGIAVWSIGYRHVDDGGAYPGIFQDVAKAIDLLPANAAKYNLDMSRVVVVGHSAGAHLGLWAAVRGKLPKTNPAYVPSPLPIRTVIGLGGVADLAGSEAPLRVCGPTILPSLVGSPSASRPDVYSDTSPMKMLPTPAKVVMITGAADKATPPVNAQAFADAVKAAGGAAEAFIVPDASHFDVVTVGTPAWQLATEKIVAALKK